MPNGVLSDRDMVIKLYTNTDNMREDVAEIKKELLTMRTKIEERPYPCNTVLELKTERNVLVGVLAISLPLIAGALLWLMDKVM